MLRVVLNKSWKRHPTKQWLCDYLPLTSQTIWRTRHVRYCLRIKDELISDVLPLTPTHGHTSVGWAHMHQLCAETGCHIENLFRVMVDRDGLQERERERERERGGGWIHTIPVTWCYICVCVCFCFVKVCELLWATLVDGDSKAPFSMATTLRCRGERYSIHWIAPLYPCSLPYNAKRLARWHQVPFLSVWYNSTWDWTSVSRTYWQTLYSSGPDIDMMVRVFANGPGDLGSIPGRVIPKTQKMILDTSLLNAQ